ncbi:MAG: hypothetical protein IJU23_02635 [Proteobacteria bacterium]|nr:hypothetical protein [Pseudomonadota bacterium]
MKSKSLFLTVLPLCILSGCILGDPLEFGDACPGLDKAGTLSYIENRQSCSAEHAYECSFDDQLDENGDKIEFDFSSYFNKRYCPPHYPKCKMDTIKDSETKQDYTFYHCEKDTRTQIECAKGQIQCSIMSNGTGTANSAEEFECIDPASTNTCGALTCDAETNYGGVNCYLYNMFSTCQKNQENKYVCMCASGALQCNEECIDPSSKITCGAHDCSKENYGGDDCTEYEDKRICKQNADGTYGCACREGYVLCDGKCIDPETSVEHCGARGLCNDSDANGEHYAGSDCGIGGVCEEGVCKCYDGDGIICDGKCVLPEANDEYCGAKGLCNDADPSSEHYRGTACGIGGVCHDGKCECYEGIRCINDDGAGECLMPSGHETCNAHLSDDGLHCEYTECKVNELCIEDSETTYRCDVTSCDETSENLCVVDGLNACVSKLDSNHCGSCDNDCAKHSFANIKSYSCIDMDGTPTCSYVCSDTTINCGSELAPHCVDTKKDTQNCGSCGHACIGNQYCNNGTCQYSACQSTQCTVMNGSEQSCVNTDTQCGGSCTSCKTIHVNGYCDNGSCFVSACNTGEHPVYNGSGKIIRCDANTVTSCAPSNMAANKTPTNCNTWKPSTASSVTCNVSTGACIITGCNTGYHISSNSTTCNANTDTACGSDSKNCNNPKPSNASGAKCDKTTGTCYVTSCNTGYHISSNSKACNANTDIACGSDSTNCNNTKPTNAATARCNTSEGSCYVTKCNSGYHVSSNSKACNTNTDSACGSDSTDCSKTKPSHAATAQCNKSAGTCYVTKCNTDYHIGSDKTSCVKNKDDLCGSTTSTKTKDCTSGVQNKCIEGKCSCPSGKELNYDKNNCVIPACAGIPGVYSGSLLTTSWYNSSNSDYACNPSKCNSDYKMQTQNNTSAHSCIPKKSLGCSKLGYKYNDGTYCIGRENGTGVNGHNHCKTGYRHYILACIDQDYCCGTRGVNMTNGLDYVCRNCKAQGKTCNISTGKCK